MKRNVAVAVAAAVLAVGVGLGAVAVTRAASAAPRSAPLPVAYNGADGWHRARPGRRSSTLRSRTSSCGPRTGRCGRARPRGRAGSCGSTRARRPARPGITAATAPRSASGAWRSGAASGLLPDEAPLLARRPARLRVPLGRPARGVDPRLERRAFGLEAPATGLPGSRVPASRLAALPSSPIAPLSAPSPPCHPGADDPFPDPRSLTQRPVAGASSWTGQRPPACGARSPSWDGS